MLCHYQYLPKKLFLRYTYKISPKFLQVKLVLKHNKYFVESPFPDVLQKLLKDPVIQECRLRRNVDKEVAPITTNIIDKKGIPQVWFIFYNCLKFAKILTFFISFLSFLSLFQ